MKQTIKVPEGCKAEITGDNIIIEIIPEKGQIKVGDWVMHIDYSCKVGKLIEIFNKPNARECYVNWGHDKSSHWKTKLKIWKPEPGEWCLFYDEVNPKSMVLSQFKYMDNLHFMSNHNIFWTNCQPFIGILPDQLKD